MGRFDCATIPSALKERLSDSSCAEPAAIDSFNQTLEINQDCQDLMSEARFPDVARAGFSHDDPEFQLKWKRLVGDLSPDLKKAITYCAVEMEPGPAALQARNYLLAQSILDPEGTAGLMGNIVGALVAQGDLKAYDYLAHLETDLLASNECSDYAYTTETVLPPEISDAIRETLSKADVSEIVRQFENQGGGASREPLLALYTVASLADDPFVVAEAKSAISEQCSLGRNGLYEDWLEWEEFCDLDLMTTSFNILRTSDALDIWGSTRSR